MSKKSKSTHECYNPDLSLCQNCTLERCDNTKCYRVAMVSEVPVPPIKLEMEDQG